MKQLLLVFAIGGALLAALGQVCFKYGADGRSAVLDFVNPWILLGLGLYGAGTLLWIRALAGTPLTVVYPFSALTFVLVNLLAVTVLGEQLSAKALAGAGLVLAGLFLLASADGAR